VVARTSDVEVMLLLNEEAEKHGDILLIESIGEHYHNITYKARAWIQWVAENPTANCALKSHCHFEFVLKIDDDVMVEPDELEMLFDRLRPHKGLIACRIFPDGQVVRNPLSKWHLSRDEYRATSLGTYCQGMAFIFTGDLILPMYGNLRRVQYLWVCWFTIRSSLTLLYLHHIGL